MQFPDVLFQQRVAVPDVDMTAVTGSPSATTDGDSSPSSARAASTQPPARKPTYIVRKEERADLLKEIDELQQQLRQLQQPHAAESYDAASEMHNLLQHELATSLLRDAVRAQQLSLVNVQSAVSGYISEQEHVPHEVMIALSSDLQQRRDALVNAKPRKIRAGLTYLQQRTRFLDLTRPFAETSRFKLPNGDYCALRCDTTPLEGISNVKKVFDAILHYFSNVEIRVTDVLGDITTRDETTYDGLGIQQNRIISHLSCGVDLEMNSIMNFEFVERSDEYADGGPFGVITCDYVDQDDLFPYHQTRVRQDVTAVMAIRPYWRRTFNTTTGREEDEQVVVLTRACFLKVHNNGIVLPPLVHHRLRKQLGQWGDVMVDCIMDSLYLGA